MAQILLDINTRMTPHDDDILIYERGWFTTISKSAFLKALIEENKQLNENINNLKNDILSLRSDIAKLKAEIDFDRGEISEEEHDELCLGNNG